MSIVKNLRRDFSDFLIDIPEWEIADQGVTALWGPSGSGKTTVFRTLLGLEPCPGLEWKFHDLDLAKLPVPQRRLGVVFQSLELFPHMSVQENVLFAAEARGLPMAETASRMARLIHELHLGNCLKRKVSVISGGEAQRTALARAIVGKPRFLFLDEPFSSLDSDLKQDARAVVKKVIEEFKIPTLLISHDREDVSSLAQTVVRIENGRLVRG